MNPVVHFELPYVDGHRIAHFYEAVFQLENPTTGTTIKQLCSSYHSRIRRQAWLTGRGHLMEGFML